MGGEQSNFSSVSQLEKWPLFTQGGAPGRERVQLVYVSTITH